jgi:hypothetical protein
MKSEFKHPELALRKGGTPMEALHRKFAVEVVSRVYVRDA